MNWTEQETMHTYLVVKLMLKNSAPLKTVESIIQNPAFKEGTRDCKTDLHEWLLHKVFVYAL